MFSHVWPDLVDAFEQSNLSYIDKHGFSPTLICGLEKQWNQNNNYKWVAKSELK